MAICFLAGRSDDVIVRGGENMSPGEIEDVLLEHAAVEDAAVVGVPSEEWGEAVVAALVLKAEATVEDLQGWVKDNMRSSRVPERIEFWDELPYNETGKFVAPGGEGKAFLVSCNTNSIVLSVSHKVTGKASVRRQYRAILARAATQPGALWDAPFGNVQHAPGPRYTPCQYPDITCGACLVPTHAGRSEHDAICVTGH